MSTYEYRGSALAAGSMFTLPIEDLRQWAGLGVAGNFAGHLEQAGEARDFANVDVEDEGAPKGLFPYYIPRADSFLGNFPLSNDSIAKPHAGGDLQIEPEVALACDLEYDEFGRVAEIRPWAFGAYNDCSIRREGAKKISEKKNWGPESKGVAAQFIALDSLASDGVTGSYRLACFLRRHGRMYPYGVDSPLLGYSYYGDLLLSWMVKKLRTQQGSPTTPLEPVGDYLRDAGRPQRALVSIGATRYTDFGERTYLDDGDESFVVVYDANETDPNRLPSVLEHESHGMTSASVLRQFVF